jgi:BolA protein
VTAGEVGGWTEADIPRLNPARIERMRVLLERALAPLALEIRDDSHRHAGHAGARGGQGHYGVDIVSAAFAGKPPLARHRLVYAALGELMQTDIHALAIRARAPDEAA